MGMIAVSVTLIMKNGEGRRCLIRCIRALYRATATSALPRMQTNKMSLHHIPRHHQVSRHTIQTMVTLIPVCCRLVFRMWVLRMVAKQLRKDCRRLLLCRCSDCKELRRWHHHLGPHHLVLHIHWSTRTFSFGLWTECQSGWCLWALVI